MDSCAKPVKKNNQRRKKNNSKAESAPIKKGQCAICKERDTEVCLSCSGMHSYCFDCLKNWAETKNSLSCPECRKVCYNFIVFPTESSKKSQVLNDFMDSVKIIPHPHCHGKNCTCFEEEFQNTSVFPDWTIRHFIDNKDQLDLYTKNQDTPDIINLINWNLVMISHD